MLIAHAQAQRSEMLLAMYTGKFSDTGVSRGMVQMDICKFDCKVVWYQLHILTVASQYLDGNCSRQRAKPLLNMIV